MVGVESYARIQTRYGETSMTPTQRLNEIAGRVDNRYLDELVVLKREDATWLLEEVRALREQEAKLREFVDHILQNYSWDNCCAEIDAADAQDKAEKLGLIEKRPVNPDDYDGADWAYFTKWTPKENEDNE